MSVSYFLKDILCPYLLPGCAIKSSTFEISFHCTLVFGSIVLEPSHTAWVQTTKIFYLTNSKDATCESSYIPNCLPRETGESLHPFFFFFGNYPSSLCLLKDLTSSLMNSPSLDKYCELEKLFQLGFQTTPPLSRPQRLLYPLQSSIYLAITFQIAGTHKKHVKYHILPFPST